MKRRRPAIPRLAEIAEQDAPAAAAQHQRGAEPRRFFARDDYIELKLFPTEVAPPPDVPRWRTCWSSACGWNARRNWARAC